MADTRTTKAIAKAYDYDLTIGQAAIYLGFSIESVRKWAKSGALKAARTPEPGKRYRFRTVDLDEFMAAISGHDAAEESA